MKANSRRRVLISSLAMLLVALVALSTATFAWFTQSTSSTANGITVKTSKTSQLKIADDKMAEFSAAGFSYNMTAIMVPASSADGQTWYYTSAAASDAFTAANTSSFSKVTDATKDKYVFVNQLNIENAGEVAIEGITITPTNFEGEYLRYALVPVSAQVEGGDTSMTADAFRANVYGTTSTDVKSYNPVESSSKISDTAITIKDSAPINVGKLDAGERAYYNLFVWFEGQDPRCFDGKAGQGVTDLSFVVTGSPVSETIPPTTGE